MTSCVKSLMEATVRLCQINLKDSTKECFIFDGCFEAERSYESMMDIGIDIVCFLIVNTKRFCKYTIDNLKKYWSGDYYLLLKVNSMVTGDRHLVVIGYQYNARKFVSFLY